jgi:hypothetical protein
MPRGSKKSRSILARHRKNQEPVVNDRSHEAAEESNESKVQMDDHEQNTQGEEPACDSCHNLQNGDAATSKKKQRKIKKSLHLAERVVYVKSKLSPAETDPDAHHSPKKATAQTGDSDRSHEAIQRERGGDRKVTGTNEQPNPNMARDAKHNSTQEAKLLGTTGEPRNVDIHVHNKTNQTNMPVNQSSTSEMGTHQTKEVDTNRKTPEQLNQTDLGDAAKQTEITHTAKQTDSGDAAGLSNTGDAVRWTVTFSSDGTNYKAPNQAHVHEESVCLPQFVFGSIHQGNQKFSPYSIGRQCSCNAMMMLAFQQTRDIITSHDIDEILNEGDKLYRSVQRKLQSRGENPESGYLTTDELPNTFSVGLLTYKVEHPSDSIYGRLDGTTAGFEPL